MISIPYTTFKWETESRKGRMLTHHWPQESPKAVIALVHGQGEHGGRYQHVAAFFHNRGYAVMAVDLVGHGLSAGKRGHVGKFQEYLDNVRHLILQSQGAYEHTPIYLYGHSMGGNIASNALLDPTLSGHIAKALITSPWLRLAFSPPKIKLFFGQIMRRIFPTFTEDSSLEQDKLSHDQHVVDNYANDPLVHSKISASAFFEIRDAGKSAISRAGELDTPTLLMHGTGDEITSHTASEEFASNAPEHLLAYKPWEGLYHELHNEEEWEDILDYAEKWLSAPR